MSRIRDVDPIFMGSSDVVVQNEGYDGCNKCLDVTEFSVAASNRELVNLENAAVNIDNSNDVIIGPVTQFNVNGNVTIFQNRDCVEEKDIKTPTCNGNQNDQPATKGSQNQHEIKSCTSKGKLKLHIGIVLVLFLAVALIIILIIFLGKNNSEVSLESSTPVVSFGTVNLFKKEQWNGRKAKKPLIPLKTPVDAVVLKHTGGMPCDNFIACAKKLQYLQSEDFTQGRNDIYCSFAIGGDGNIYEGRGWDFKPEYLINSTDIVLLGNFATDEFTPPMITATKALLEYGVKENKLTKDYRLINHNHTAITLSPGINVIKKVIKWPHYDGNNYIGQPLLILNSPKKTDHPNNATSYYANGYAFS